LRARRLESEWQAQQHITAYGAAAHKMEWITFPDWYRRLKCAAANLPILDHATRIETTSAWCNKRSVRILFLTHVLSQPIGVPQSFYDHTGSPM
jgi:hypothetical protein